MRVYVCVSVKQVALAETNCVILSIVYRLCHQSSSAIDLVLLELDDHGVVFAAQTKSLEETLWVDVANEIVSLRHQLAKKVINNDINH